MLILLFSSFFFVFLRWLRATKTPTPPSSTTSTLRSSLATCDSSRSSPSRRRSAWEWSCTAVRGRVRRPPAPPPDISKSSFVDLTFYFFSGMFTKPWERSRAWSESPPFSSQETLLMLFFSICVFHWKSLFGVKQTLKMLENMLKPTKIDWCFLHC